jgi:hypothetical protein
MAMRVRAKVKQVLEPPANYIGTIVDDQPVPVTRLPDPDWLEISEEDGAFFLFYLDAELECFADTWHQTFESAQREAQIGFGIAPDEWREVEPS